FFFQAEDGIRAWSVTGVQTCALPIYGQAALHQLLLWTDARFEYHHRDVVRRQQIPLAPDELFADAERFLEGVRESSGGLSPAMEIGRGAWRGRVERQRGDVSEQRKSD